MKSKWVRIRQVFVIVLIGVGLVVSMEGQPTQARQYTLDSNQLCETNLGNTAGGLMVASLEPARTEHAVNISLGGAASGGIPSISIYQFYSFLPYVSKHCPATYFEDFSYPSTDWPVYEDSQVKYAYVGGEYQILVKNAGGTKGVVGEYGLSNIRLEADVRVVSQLDGSPGLIFGWSNAGGLYVFEIKNYPDYGYYQLIRLDPAGWYVIVPSTYSSYINPGTQSNHLKVERNGNDIAMYANDHLLTATVDSTYHGTGVGLISFAYNYGNFDTRYDNFALYRYNCDSSQAMETQNVPSELMNFDAEPSDEFIMP
jgi:hypothetical protein